MIIRKNYSLKNVLQFTGGHLVWLTVWASAAVCIYHFGQFRWLSIPWLPLSVVGTAVAFYVGFKNNSAYDRMWEARKIWGAITNSSRAWGSYTRSFVSNQFASTKESSDGLKAIHQRLIYRHIAWLYTLRDQLLVPQPWEHINQKGHIGNKAQVYISNFGVGLVRDEVNNINVSDFLSEEESERISHFTNPAAQLIDFQSQDLQKLRERDLIEDFRHMELQRILADFYIHQGMVERIKKFPLPRQYGNMSFIFIGIFIFLLPFGMISEFTKLGDYGIWLTIPFTILVGWIYVVMELVGDYTENPFQGMSNDIPMLSICRNIEIDLREMLGETNVPKPILAKDGILM